MEIVKRLFKNQKDKHYKKEKEFEIYYDKLKNNSDFKIIHAEFKPDSETLKEMLSIFYPVIIGFLIENYISQNIPGIFISIGLLLYFFFFVTRQSKSKKICKIVIQYTNNNNPTNLINAGYIFKYFDILDNPIDEFITLKYKYELKAKYVKKFAEEHSILIR